MPLHVCHAVKMQLTMTQLLLAFVLSDTKLSTMLIMEPYSKKSSVRFALQESIEDLILNLFGSVKHAKTWVRSMMRPKIRTLVFVTLPMDGSHPVMVVLNKQILTLYLVKVTSLIMLFQ